MKYTFVKSDGNIGATREFVDAPPELAANKGKWLPDNPPPYNSTTHTRALGVQSVNAAEIAYVVSARPINEVRDIKLAELQAARNAAEAANVTVQGKTFSAEPSIAKRFESLAARLRRGKPTTLTAIFQVNGSPVFPVTQALLDQIEDAIAAQGEAAWKKYADKVALVTAATTVEAVFAITW